MTGGRHVRPASTQDLAALTELCRAAETHWFGAPERDEAEVREELERLDDLELDTRLSFDDDVLVCAVLHGRHESFVLVRPGLDPGSLHEDALDWLTRRAPVRVEVLDRDAELLDVLAAHGWQHAHSSFDLSRPVSGSRPTEQPVCPEGIALGDARPDELHDVHRLIYAEAGFGDVPGHVRREFDEWRELFLGDRPLSNAILARRDGRPVGASLTRTFSDGLGWISQLAVVPGERGRGVGRALVLESFRRLVAGGATSLGLGVMAANRGALGLYLSLGLAIDREWQLWDAPATG